MEAQEGEVLEAEEHEGEQRTAARLRHPKRPDLAQHDASAVSRGRGRGSARRLEYRKKVAPAAAAATATREGRSGGTGIRGDELPQRCSTLVCRLSCCCYACYPSRCCTCLFLSVCLSAAKCAHYIAGACLFPGVCRASWRLWERAQSGIPAASVDHATRVQR